MRIQNMRGARLVCATIATICVGLIFLGVSDIAFGEVLTGTPVNFFAPQGVPFNGSVGTFTSSNPGSLVGDFSATINWGDGSAPTSATAITLSAGTFTINGSHTYASSGTFTVTVVITSITSATQTIVDTATVALELTGTPVNFSAIQGVPFNGSVGTFTSAKPGSLVGDFSATINWGDGSAPTAATNITSSAGTFTVNGSHTYASSGTFTVNVAITDTATSATLTIVDTATVAPELTGTPVNFSAIQGVPFNGSVGTFTSAKPGSLVGDFSATINWGDGSALTPATSITLSAGTFTVNGNHTYALSGTFTVSVTITDTATSATLTIVDTATVARELTGTPVSFLVTQGEPFSDSVGTFTSAKPGSLVSDFTATIDWGDGSALTPATSITLSAGTFTVTGSHTYASSGVFTVSVAITDTTTSATLTIVDSVTSVRPIPALNEWTLAWLTCLLLVVGAFTARGRRW